jgi:hypothetical protein
MRHIIFERDEVVAAVEAFLRRRSERGYLVALEIVSRPAIRADIRLRSERNSEERKVQFDHAKLAAALIAFCNEKRIPLARRAEKRLAMLGDNLALLVSLNLPPESIDELERLLLAPYYTTSDDEEGLPVFVARR